ncbi:hypothetical protein NL676_039512 [Syzygium grande]|nr:hypothetical protein NL676_039512 [Syzygium grande]
MAATALAVRGRREMAVEVKVVGQEAVVRAWSPNLEQPRARFMDVLKEYGVGGPTREHVVHEGGDESGRGD